MTFGGIVRYLRDDVYFRARYYIRKAPAETSTAASHPAARSMVQSIIFFVPVGSVRVRTIMCVAGGWRLVDAPPFFCVTSWCLSAG